MALKSSLLETLTLLHRLQTLNSSVQNVVVRFGGAIDGESSRVCKESVRGVKVGGRHDPKGDRRAGDRACSRPTPRLPEVRSWNDGSDRRKAPSTNPRIWRKIGDATLYGLRSRLDRDREPGGFWPKLKAVNGPAMYWQRMCRKIFVADKSPKDCTNLVNQPWDGCTLELNETKHPPAMHWGVLCQSVTSLKSMKGPFFTGTSPAKNLRSTFKLTIWRFTRQVILTPSPSFTRSTGPSFTGSGPISTKNLSQPSCGPKKPETSQLSWKRFAVSIWVRATTDIRQPRLGALPVFALPDTAPAFRSSMTPEPRHLSPFQSQRRLEARVFFPCFLQGHTYSSSRAQSFGQALRGCFPVYLPIFPT